MPISPSTKDSTLDAPSRLDALARTGLLDAPTHEPLDRLVRLAMRLLDAPVGLLSFVEPHRQFFVSATGLPEPWASRRETPLTHSFCQHVARSGETLDVPDALAHPLVRDNLAIPDLGVHAYLGAPVRSADGEVLGALCVIDGKPRDWSDRDLDILDDLAEAAGSEVTLCALWAERERQARAQLESQQAQVERLRALDRMKDEFVSTVTHELRTPLTAITGFGELMLDEPDRLDPDHHSHLGTILRAAGRLQRLVDDLDDLSSLNRSVMTIERNPVVLSRLVRQEVDTVRHVAEEKRLVLSTTVTPGVAVLGDALRLRQAVQCLLTNATTYTEPGGEIEVTLREGDGHAVLVVSDTGIGIPDDERDRVFERFFRATTALERAIQGLGLGLSLARGIVERHDGRIGVESRPLGGTRFRVVLPLLTG